ncbi:hypothetical protein HY988_05535 [Candidatus Micrarchaeota archaeon]|nr:hypothetical protein [Candidatus Micrarchaeota archaeon]
MRQVHYIDRNNGKKYQLLFLGKGNYGTAQNRCKNEGATIIGHRTADALCHQPEYEDLRREIDHDAALGTSAPSTFYVREWLAVVNHRAFMERLSRRFSDFQTNTTIAIEGQCERYSLPPDTSDEVQVLGVYVIPTTFANNTVVANQLEFYYPLVQIGAANNDAVIPTFQPTPPQDSLQRRLWVRWDLRPDQMTFRPILRDLNKAFDRNNTVYAIHNPAMEMRVIGVREVRD